MISTTVSRGIIKWLFMVAGLMASALPVCAWNNVGHRTIAELAWRQMNSKERHAATALLEQHPHYDRLLSVDVPAGVDSNEWVFLTAAVWPDMVRHAKPGQPQKPHSITKYDLYPHAIGYPFVRPADRNSVSISNFFIAKPDAEMVLSNSLATLRDRNAAPHDRAVSLCWAMHLIGDLHQPLHTATWVRKDKFEWDGLGGNYIVIDENGEQIDMHRFWDRLGGENSSYSSISALADRLAHNVALNPRRLEEYKRNKTIPAWVQESHRLAVDFAYAESKVQFAHIDDLNAGKVKPAEIPHLTPNYVAEARRIADRRFVLAGQRLADELKRIW